jgi:hypothetical protein
VRKLFYEAMAMKAISWVVGMNVQKFYVAGSGESTHRRKREKGRAGEEFPAARRIAMRRDS